MTDSVQITNESLNSIEVIDGSSYQIDLSMAVIGPTGLQGSVGPKGDKGDPGVTPELPIDPVLLFENALI